MGRLDLVNLQDERSKTAVNLLDYCCVLKPPFEAIDTVELEDVQRGFTALNACQKKKTENN